VAFTKYSNKGLDDQLPSKEISHQTAPTAVVYHCDKLK